MRNTRKSKTRWFLRVELILLVCAICLFIFKLVTDNIDKAYAQSRLGDRYFDAEQYEQAAKAYEQAIKINPIDDSIDYYNLGITYDYLDRSEDAIKAYKKAIEIDPDDADIHHCLGLVYEQLHRFDEAISSILKAVQLEPSDSQMWQDLGDAYASSGRYEEAIRVYQAASQTDPEWAWPHFSLAWTYHHDLQKYEEAAKEWKWLIERKPNIAGSYLLLGCSYEKAGEIQKAHNAFSKAKELKPHIADEIFQNGNQAYNSGDYKAAIDCYSNVLRLEPDRADAHYFLGKTYIQLKKKDLAKKVCQSLEKLDDELTNDLLDLINQ
jgi:tetratricopeptide (TPR) repeat protein